MMAADPMIGGRGRGLLGGLARLLRPWPGEVGADQIKAETYMAWVRGFCAVVTAVLVPFLAVEPLGPLLGTIAFALSYDAVLLFYVIPRKPDWLRGGYLTATLDTLSISAAVAVTGGLDSPFYIIYYANLSLHAIRFSGLQVLALTPLAAIGYTLAIVIDGDPIVDNLGPLAFRLFWATTFPVFVGVAVERARSAEISLAAELRRTRALLQAAHAPAASLTVDGVLAAVLEQARRLTESEVAAIRLEDHDGRGTTYRGQIDTSAAGAAFGRMIRSNGPARRVLLAAASPLTPADLASRVPNVPPELRAFSSLCAAAIPAQAAPLGCVVVARRSGPPLADVELEALAAFVQRAALALQNARLYEQLQAQMDELRALHDQIVRAERLAAIGELAAKVAHEINNPLASIHMYNSLLLEDPVDPSEQRHVAMSVQEQVERAKRVVRDILDFSRPHQPHPEVAAINSTAAYGLSLIRHAAASTNVLLREYYAQDLPPVLVDRGQFGQVLVNLASNAIDAMPNGGELTIRTGMREGELYVQIGDTGCGIAPEHLDRVFEPFFTTKPPGRGTGLGLAVCRTLVAQQHGRLTVASEPGKGSVFTLWLPPAVALEAQHG